MLTRIRQHIGAISVLIAERAGWLTFVDEQLVNAYLRDWQAPKARQTNPRNSLMYPLTTNQASSEWHSIGRAVTISLAIGSILPIILKIEDIRYMGRKTLPRFLACVLVLLSSFVICFVAYGFSVLTGLPYLTGIIVAFILTLTKIYFIPPRFQEEQMRSSVRDRALGYLITAFFSVALAAFGLYVYFGFNAVIIPVSDPPQPAIPFYYSLVKFINETLYPNRYSIIFWLIPFILEIATIGIRVASRYDSLFKIGASINHEEHEEHGEHGKDNKDNNDKLPHAPRG